ncbi:MAG: hypothetical protein AAGI38_20350 [Bacteroidota bacterium]
MKSFVFLILLLAAQWSFAQRPPYDLAAGFRTGPTTGVNLKGFFSDNSAAEGILGWRRNGLYLAGLYEFHLPLADLDGNQFFVYLGGGAHVAHREGRWSPIFEDEFRQTDVGLDGVIGLELALDYLPFAFSLDYKPGLNFNNPDVYWNDLGLSVRFILK